MTKLNFVVSDAQLSVIKATNIGTLGPHIKECPFVVGDFISFPLAPALYFRVTTRSYMSRQPPAESEWKMTLELAQDPIHVLAPPNTSRD